MKPIEIADGIYWVGSVDWNIRDFHGYSTYQGTTYNAYLILDEKITLIDAVKKEFSDELISSISQIIDPKKIAYVISNHTEMDHTGGLARVMHKIGEEKPLFCSKMGHKNLARHFDQMWNYRPVKNGEELSLGKRTLTFMETRMLHWPDSMFSYLKEDKILFSSDAFGQHYAGLERFDDQRSTLLIFSYYTHLLFSNWWTRSQKWDWRWTWYALTTELCGGRIQRKLSTPMLNGVIKSRKGRRWSCMIPCGRAQKRWPTPLWMVWLSKV